MKTFPPITAVLASSLLLADTDQRPALLTAPPDGSAEPAPEVRAVFKPAEVLETTITRQGGRDIIVQHLALDPDDPIKPVFPTPPPALPAHPAPSGDSGVPPAHFQMLSATVHPGPRTSLMWTHRFPDGASREFSGWSNIDFNHLFAIGTFIAVDGTERAFQMGIASGERIPIEKAPAFTSKEPTFIPDGEVPSEALIVIDSLHKIYATEGVKLAAAHAGRERAWQAKQAELLANPPKPKDLIIRYRIAETPLPTPVEGGAR